MILAGVNQCHLIILRHTTPQLRHHIPKHGLNTRIFLVYSPPLGARLAQLLLPSLNGTILSLILIIVITQTQILQLSELLSEMQHQAQLTLTSGLSQSHRLAISESVAVALPVAANVPTTATLFPLPHQLPILLLFMGWDHRPILSLLTLHSILHLTILLALQLTLAHLSKLVLAVQLAPQMSGISFKVSTAKRSQFSPKTTRFPESGQVLKNSLFWHVDCASACTTLSFFYFIYKIQLF